MLKNHPKGLLVAFFSNMGERFGFYTMMAILVLFLQAKYGLNEQDAGNYYSWFYFGIYALALVGGIVADTTRKYKFVILLGILIMFAGYFIMALPGNSLIITLLALFTIAFGNGLFKGNLQAVVGQMYDDPQYSKVRDSGYMIFYMGINIGAFFAPFIATGVRNWFLKTQGFLHDASLPAMCHQFIDGKLQDTAKFQEIANHVNLSGAVTDLSAFAHSYLEAFSKGYNYAFGIAAISMIISLLVYIIFNSKLPNVQKTPKKAEGTSNLRGNVIAFLLAGGLMAASAVVFQILMQDLAFGLAIGLFLGFVAMMFMISTKEERPRVTSLILVFFVVVFFWMSFHQNGLTLTYFARDYIVKEVGPFTNIFFNLEQILTFIGTVAGIVLIFQKKKQAKYAGMATLLVFGALTVLFVLNNKPNNPIAPEVFQSFNPLFIVALTFPVMGVFEALRKKDKEPSTPKKIGIGMIIAAIGFAIMIVASLGLVSPIDLKFTEVIDGKEVVKFNPVPDASRVVPYWLITSYLVLTIAELFLSPMGLSFVSKVAPTRFQGLMQAGWLLATATGNKLLFIGSFFWSRLPLWQLWSIFVICCLLSALFIFIILKRLENATNPQPVQ